MTKWDNQALILLDSIATNSLRTDIFQQECLNIMLKCPILETMIVLGLSTVASLARILLDKDFYHFGLWQVY